MTDMKRYWNDPVYRTEELARNAKRRRQKYKIDITYRAKAIASTKDRYKNNPEYRARSLALAHEKWINDPAYRNRLREASRKAQGLPTPTRPVPDACEICERKSEKALCLEHCHLTRTFRGWVCYNCNLGLEHFRDSPEVLERAARYLRGFYGAPT